MALLFIEEQTENNNNGIQPTTINNDNVCRQRRKIQRRISCVRRLKSDRCSINAVSYSHLKSTRLKTKHLLAGLGILVLAILVTAVVVYWITAPSKGINRVVPFEPPDPEVTQPPSHSVLHQFKKGAVCTDGPPCSKIGRNVLDKGGSAVDATLAALFCNGVVNSQSMGLGGGFIMTIYNRTEGKAYSLIGRERAPIKATKDMFINDTEKSRTGVLASAVPGELRGYWAAWKRFGKLPWAEILAPTVKLCRDGYHMSKHQFDSLQFRAKSLLEDDDNFREWFLQPGTNEIKPAGSLIRPTRLCETLQTIADEGGDVLYNGTLAKIFVEDVQALGGIITLEDMERQTPIWREPIEARLHSDYTVYTAPPPGGGLVMALILNIIDGYKMDQRSVANVDKSILTSHRIVEAFKYAFALRSEVADPDFVNIKELVNNLTSKQFAESIRNKIQDDRTFDDPKHYGAIFYEKEDHGTAHISVLSPSGDAVSVTSTVNLYFGAGVTSRRTGIALNSGMDDFSVPGHVNFFGVYPSPRNFIEPRKMSTSSVSPTIIVGNDGNVAMVIGASGGTKIITAVAEVILNYMSFNKTLKEAVDKSRIHHQLFPMEINYEYGVIEPLVAGLKKLGHKMTRYRDRGSIVCALARRNDTVYANADYRKGGEVYGMD